MSRDQNYVGFRSPDSHVDFFNILVPGYFDRRTSPADTPRSRIAVVLPHSATMAKWGVAFPVPFTLRDGHVLDKEVTYSTDAVTVDSGQGASESMTT